MKNIKHSRIISAILSVAMLVTSAGIIPVTAGAADTDAVVTHFGQMRCNNTKTNTSSYTNDTYYGSGYLINILDGSYLSDYAGNVTSTRADAEIKTDAREYGLMRIKLNSENTGSVDIQFAVNGTNKTFSAYEYNNEHSDWTEQALTDNNHVPTSVAAVDITYAASLATGYDWSQKGVSFDAVNPVSEDTSGADKLIDFSIPVSDEDNAAGYKDILIKNNTSDTDATKIIVGTPVVTTHIKSIPASVEITGTDTINITNKNRVQITEYTAEVTDNNGTVCTDKVTWSVVSGEAEIKETNGKAVLMTKQTISDGDIVIIKASVNETVFAEKNITISQTFAKNAAIAGEQSSTVYVSMLPAAVGKYIANVTDAYGKAMNTDVVYSVSDTDHFEISAEGILTVKANVAAGEYSTDITATVDADECENGTAVVSAPFKVTVTVSAANPEIILNSSQLLWFRANGKSNGAYDGSCGSNWYYSGDSGLKEINEIESGTGFGLITSFDIGGIDSSEKDLYNFKLKLTSSGASEKLAIWSYDNSNIPYYGGSVDKKAVTTAIKTMLPAWNTDWVYGTSTENAAPLAVASVSDGIYTFEFSYEQLKEYADQNGIASFFVTSENLSSRVSATKVYLSGDNAPKMTYSYRAKPQVNGVTIKGADKIVFSGKTPDGDNVYEGKFKTQFEDVFYDITDGITTWNIEGNSNITYDKATGKINVSDELAEGTYMVTLKFQYEKDGTIYNAEKNIEIEKKAASVITSVRVSGNSSVNLVTSELPVKLNYTAEVLNQFGEVIKGEECVWSVSGANVDGITIDDHGVLTVGNGVKDSLAVIKAMSVTSPTVFSELSVAIHVSEYASTLYPEADVLFRKGNTDTKNVNGAELEITNSVDNDRAFVGGLKFDISSVKRAIEAKQPIVSIKLRLTSSLSKDGKLMLKPLSNDWSEAGSIENSYEAKSGIITEAVSSVANVIDNEENKAFTLNRKTKDKYIYEVERAENETIETWQTELDITDYLLGTGTDSDLNKNGYIEDNKNEDFVSFLIMANYNGTNANKIFTKDVSEITYADHWQALIEKFPELGKNTDILKPAIIIDYAKESVRITSGVSTIPVPLTDTANSVRITAEHYNPFTGETDKDISWSIAGYSNENGEYNGIPNGVIIASDGTLSVSKTASAGTVTVRAASSNPIIYKDFKVSVVKLADQLVNGSFESVTDAMMPTGWTSYDKDIDGAYNGVRRYKMEQTAETQLSNITRTNDDDGLVSGSYTADSKGNKGLMFKGASGIDKDYEGYAYAHNAANNSVDGGPDIRVTSGITYWISQDYRMENLYQLNDSAVVGPYMSYEGFQGTTSKKSQFSGTWYFKDGNPTQPYTTEDYDTLVKQITVPVNVNRLRINWGFKACEGEIFYRNFRIAPQGIDSSKPAADGMNELKVTEKMTWTSDPIVVAAGSEYSYKLSVMTDNVSSGLAVIVFKNSEGEIISEKKIKQSKTLQWVRSEGTVVPPANTAYAEIRLENDAKSGSVWYDDIIFTQSANPVSTYIKLKSDNTLVISPVNGENRYMFTASVTDQYNNPCEAEVKWSVNYAGLSVLENGTLIVSSDAVAGNAVITAETEGRDGKISDAFTVKIIKQTVNAENVSLLNGDFSEKDENNLPDNWTDSDRELSIANRTFDTSVSGWRLNYTTYTPADTSALIEWDASVDHTGNSGGSAKIYNADRAQGSMQISDNISVTGGQMYDLAVWVKTNNVSTDSNVYVNVLLYDKNGSTIEENKQLLRFYPENTDGKGNNTSDWTKLSGSMFINENAVKMRIDMRYRGGANNINGTVWFDDLAVTKQAGIDNEKLFNGKSVLMLKGYNFESNDFSRTYGEKWDSALISNISEGQEYYYSVNAQTLDASDGAYVMITYYNSAGRVIGTDKSDKISDEHTWKEIKGASTAPAGAVSAVMSLCIDGKGTAWFADAKFETKAITEVTEIAIEGNDTVMAASENYYYAVITDQYGLQSDRMNIAVTADNVPSGMKYDSKSGKLTVSDNISGGTGITLKSAYNGLTATKNVRTLAETTSITISGSNSVTIPASSSKTVVYKVYNQISQQIDSSDVIWSVSSDDVSISDGILTIPAGISSKTIIITAQYSGLKASMSVMLTSNPPSQGGGGGGGGGGGQTWTGDKVQISVTPAPNVMGNFDTDIKTNNGLTQNSGTTVESLLPQPDPTYFTQGMDNIAGFTDIGSVKWAHKAIVSLRNVDIIHGKEETKFYPDDSITRAEFVQMLIGMLNYAQRIDVSEAECKFEDVLSDAWYYDSVAAAVKYDIVSGISSSEFAPDALISRQDMCVMIDRACAAADIALHRGASVIFNDESNISSYAVNSVRDMSRAGIVSGFEDGNFKPLENATRAQAAVIIYRMAGGAE